MTKEFILKSLLPYKENPEICGYNGSFCAYLTNDNKKCAIGQYMKPGPWQDMEGSVNSLFKKYPEKDIMSEEWLEQKISLEVAYTMQGYHDDLATSKTPTTFCVEKLEKLTGFDLKELL